jgi:NAD(P)-dependent dehydrogenase (short-subunit alcohol dehydrogenase family)
MELGLRGRHVLVTGGTRGMGQAIAVAYGREHARVALTYHEDAGAAKDVAGKVEAVGGEAVVVRLDLAERASIEHAVASVSDQFGGLDVLVANAIRWPTDASGPIADTEPQVWEHALRTNLEGTAATVRESMPHLEKSDAGRIVLISSGVSRHGMAGATAYATAKAALDGLMAALKWEAGERGVLVNIVSPGFTVTQRNLERFPVETRESVRQQTPSRRLSAPEDVAPAVMFLGSPANGNITGTYLPVAGGID